MEGGLCVQALPSARLKSSRCQQCCSSQLLSCCAGLYKGHSSKRRASKLAAEAAEAVEAAHAAEEQIKAKKEAGMTTSM